MVFGRFAKWSNARAKATVVSALCPNCEGQVNLGRKPGFGARINCPTCETELEIVWLDPPELDFPWEYPNLDDSIFDENEFADYWEHES